MHSDHAKFKSDEKNSPATIELMRAQTSTTIRLHAGLVIAQLLCWSLFVFELSRALGGNTLSWAYVVEWPVLAGYAIFMWRRLLQQERGEDAASQRTASAEDPGPDPALDAWNEYLAKVHQADPPRDGPPTAT